MAATLSDYIADTRRLSRVTSTLPFSDAVVTKFINETKDYVASLVPFALVHSYYSSQKGKTIYYLPNDILVVLTCRIYPFGGSYLTATAGAADNTITVNSTASFPDTGEAIIGEPPNHEIIAYTGKTATQLTGCSRGQRGTTAAMWTYDPSTYTPVRVWSQSAKWQILEPSTDVSVFKDADWVTDLETLVSSQTAPQSFAIRGRALLFDAPLWTDGFANIQLHCLITPPDLVSDTDVIYGLPDAFEKVIPVGAAISILKALGGEDAMTRAGALQEEFQVLVSRLHNYVENTVRGIYGAVAVETFRSATRQGRQR